MTLASWYVGPMQFERPEWLALIPVLGLASWWMSRRSLAGLGGVTRWVSLAVRMVVIVLLACALAEPSWRREAKDVAVTAVLDVSQSVPGDLQQMAEAFVERARTEAKNREDRLGLVTAAKDGYVQALPSKLTRSLDRQHVGAIDGTNLATALRLALAIRPEDAAYRVLIASDGNETGGNLLEEVERAKALNVPIDVLPIRYNYPSEVIVDRVVVPGAAREGESISVRVVLTAEQATRGRIAMLMNGEPLNLGGDGGASEPVELVKGVNVKTLSLPVKTRGPQRFEAVFLPETVNGRTRGDTIAENNKSAGITFVAGEGRVLVLLPSGDEATASACASFLGAMEQAKIKVEVRTGGQAPTTLADWNAYDAVVLFNVPADEFSLKQQEDLRQYIHDGGGGLVMVGGPQSFGAGGWIGSPVEDALPVRLDPPQKRQMPKGALAIIVHSVELPEGVFWGKKVCEAAVNALSRLDMVGINEFDWQSGTRWVHPVQLVGDGSKVKRAIQNLTFGDMPDFGPSFQLTYDGLMQAKAEGAGQCHVIVISDGDPQTPSTALLDKYRAAGITVSAVGMSVHGVNESQRMKFIAEYTKGRFYEVKDSGGLAKLPQIFVKEAQTVKRTLIQEGPPFSPQVVGVATDAMRGIGQVPQMNGYVVTAQREGLALVTMQRPRGKGEEADPLLAQWQHGLGKVVAYTSDATKRWNSQWVSWQGFRAFWEQHVRWVMRPTGSANIRVFSETKGDQTTVTVDAQDAAGERLNFAKFKGRMALPDGSGVDVELKQIGPGRYQGVVATPLPGSSIVSLRYAAPDASTASGVMEGSVQAGINRPFADEFRSLQDNAALLEQVAARTGGRVIKAEELQTAAGAPGVDLWRREGVEMPVALRPIWLFVAVAAIGLFLMDVGVRRVRIDVPAMWRATLRLFGKGRQVKSESLGGLKAAREQAKARIAKREMNQAEREAARAVEAAEKATAKVKFEASPEQARRAASQPVALGGADAKPSASTPGAEQAAKQEKADQQKAGEGLGRLMKAKQKAREEME